MINLPYLVEHLPSPHSLPIGLFTTFSDNFAKVKEYLADFLLPEKIDLVGQRVDLILHTMETAPKSMRWRARARIGRRMDWYDLPDEVKR
ncbi:MAG: hypothetical protein NTW99_03770 [Chloroflexi bacterium]|nr:hypothetical protein [Chloroflexota bacterium]